MSVKNWWTAQNKTLSVALKNKLAGCWTFKKETSSYYTNEMGYQEREALSQNTITGVLHGGKCWNGGYGYFADTTHEFSLKTTDLSFSLWFKSSTPGATVFPFGKTPIAASNELWGIYFQSTGAIGTFCRSTTATVNTDNSGLLYGSSYITPIFDNNWHLLVVTYNRAGYMETYIDGEKLAQRASLSSSVFDDYTSARSIGVRARSDGASVYQGLMHDVRLFKKVLTREEIKDLYYRNMVSGVSSIWTCEDSSGYDSYSNNDLTTVSVSTTSANIYSFMDTYGYGIKSSDHSIIPPDLSTLSSGIPSRDASGVDLVFKGFAKRNLIKVSTDIVKLPAYDTFLINSDKDAIFYSALGVPNEININTLSNRTGNTIFFNSRIKKNLIMSKSDRIMTPSEVIMSENYTRNSHIKQRANVIILTGQSNALGQAGDSTYKTIYYGEQFNIYILTEGNYLTYPETAHFVKMNPPSNTQHRDYTNPTNPYYQQVGWSFEQECSHKLQNYLKEPIFIIKVAYGGEEISSWLSGGNRYQEYMSYIPQAISILTSMGYDATFLSILWAQGESDAINGTYSNYQTSIQTVLNNIRNLDPKLSNTRFCMLKLRTDTGMPAGGVTAVNNAFTGIVSGNPNCTIIDSGITGEGVHYSFHSIDVVGNLWYSDIITHLP